MPQKARQHLLGIFGLFIVLSFVGTAIGASAPVRKPQMAAAVLPAAAAQAVATEADVIISADKVVFTSTVLPKPKPGIFAAHLQVPALKPENARTAQAAPRASLLNRMIGRIGAAKRLGEIDAARYAHIFAFQDIGEFAAADVEIAKLQDDRLMGHVLYQRYMHPDYKSTAAELADWMRQYNDHPGAQRVSDLAERRGAKNMPAPKKSRGVYSLHDFDIGQLPQPYMMSVRLGPRAKEIRKAVSRVVAGSPASALRQLETEEARQVFTHTEYDSLLADIASSYFYNGKTDLAYEYARMSADRSGDELPMAGWIAGLAAWKQQNYADAARYFEMVATCPRSSAWMASAGAHWAARSHLRNHQPQKVSAWLKKAAEHPRTFYGIISLKTLGMEQARFSWRVPELTEKHLRALAESDAGRRAVALVDAERPDLAEMELRQINPGRNHLLQESMIALALKNGMPALAMRMGSAFRSPDGELYDAALYPDAAWSPDRGFEVDRALVYAFIRQESRFDPYVKNKSSGAQGLMQLMPATARHVAGLSGNAVDGNKLLDPTVNIDLGQKYIGMLLEHDRVDDNLFKLAVAYNAGPGKLGRWQQKVRYEDDPLLFIESIPSGETRIFVERVLTNYWIYRIKFGQDTNSLDDVAQGQWPAYTAQDMRRGSSFAAAALFSRQ